MTDREQTDNFASELDLLIDRYRREYDLTYAQVIGVMQIKICLLCTEGEDGE